MLRNARSAALFTLTLAASAACSVDDLPTTPPGTAGGATAAGGGAAAQSGSGGGSTKGGAAGVSALGGAAGKGGAGGAATGGSAGGTAGVSGAGGLGKAGTGGAAASAGAGGSTAGKGGASGNAGNAGKSGASGASAGAAGSGAIGGASSIGGGSGTSGVGGALGGAAGVSGSAGSGAVGGTGGSPGAGGMSAGAGGISAGAGGIAGASGAGTNAGASGSSGSAGAAGCSAPLTDCGGTCVDLTQDPNNCNGCATQCAIHSNATPACVASTCANTCASGWGDCDGMVANGCESDVTGDTQNCGACKHICGNANTVGAMAVCTNNACVFNCTPGTTHCSGNDITGCETSIGGDPNNCGACGFACGGTIPCVDGVCKYTTDGELLDPATGTSGLAIDATTLYWFDSYCLGGSHVIRKVAKDGSGLGNVWDASKISCPSPAGLAVDMNRLYFYDDAYGDHLYKGVKSGAQDPVFVSNGPGASGQALILDVDDSQNAKYVFSTHKSNGVGIYRFDLSMPGVVTGIYTSNEVRGMVRWGTTLYFGALGTNSILYFDVTQGTPSVKTLGSLGGTPSGLATDGVNVYAACYDGNLYSISIATGNSTKIATGGPGSAVLATDGINVYVAADSGGLYRIPVGASGSWAPHLMIKYSQLVGGNDTLKAVGLDANAVYFATVSNVYKTHK